MKTETKTTGPCPTFFRATCRKAAEGGPDNGYDQAGYTLCGALANLIDNGDDDERGAKLEELSALICGPGRYVRSLPGFLASPDADAVIAWFNLALPRCMALIPSRRRTTFLRGVYRYVVEEENDVTTW